MAQRASESPLDLKLAESGVSRRDFVKWCAGVAVMLGMGEGFAPQIAEALQTASFPGKLTPALWINGGACTGCTESAAQSTDPSIDQIVLDILSLNYIETIMWAQGDAAEKAATATADAEKGKFIMIYEGSVMQGWGGNALRTAGTTGLKVIDDLAPKAAAIVAVGSCAVDGGWVKAAPNPADATGISMYLQEKGIATPVINLPTCPVNPRWIVAIIIDVLLLGKFPPVDAFGRPTLIYGRTIHDQCPRRGHFENGEFVYEFGTEEETMNYCLYAKGCKGPQTYTDCPIVRWNNKVSWCVDAGSPCIGCGNFDWVDQDAPFLHRFRKIDPAGVNLSPTAIALGAGGIVAAGLVAHGIGTAVSGRRPNGAPREAQKEFDRKKEGDN